VPEKSNFLGLQENVASAVVYVCGVLSSILAVVVAILALVFETSNNKIRFNALQSIVWFGVLTVLRFVLGGFFIFRIIITVVNIASAAFLAYKAFSDVEFRLPIIGDVVHKQIYKD
jgi:uncharacterized membrane protein